LTYRQLAQRLNAKLGTLYALVSEKRIPHVRLGKRFVRFSRAAIDAWVAEQVVAPRPEAPPITNGRR
jgi:excisionase family DNA binding protein